MRFIGFLFKFISFVMIVLLIVTGTLLSLGLSDKPLYVEKIKITDAEIEDVRLFIEKNNPLYFKQGQKKTLSISEKQVALLIKYLKNKVQADHYAKVKFFNSAAYIITSIELPVIPLVSNFGRYVNLSASVKKEAGGLILKSLEIGGIQLPDEITAIIWQTILPEIRQRSIVYQEAIDSITDFSIKKQVLDINFVWNKAIANQVKNNAISSIFSADMLNRLNVYTEHLSLIIPQIKTAQPSLVELMQPMFKLALQRSKSNDPVLENRALFIVLGAYMLDKNIPRFIGNRNSIKLVYKNFYLNRRDDLSKHFLVSSALTALADPGVAHAIGLEKEIKDSDGGSGFSFADLAADRAGVTLANTALASKKYASMLQSRLAQSKRESDFMPNIYNLPEGLQKLNFSKIYQNTESDLYKRVIQLIDQRIRQCGIYTSY